MTGSTVFSKKLIKAPLCASLPKKHHTEALRIFKEIQIYMGDGPKGNKESSSFNTLTGIANAVNRHGRELIDETFCQLIKQTSNNPRNDSDSRGWELIVACVYKCVPSAKLLPFLRFHVTRRMKEPTPRGSLAFRTWQRLLNDAVPKLPSSVREVTSQPAVYNT